MAYLLCAGPAHWRELRALPAPGCKHNAPPWHVARGVRCLRLVNATACKPRVLVSFARLDGRPPAQHVAAAIKRLLVSITRGRGTGPACLLAKLRVYRMRCINSRSNGGVRARGLKRHAMMPAAFIRLVTATGMEQHAVLKR
jgi:hypothetical protein